MLRNIYIMVGILCISALMQGAADNAEDRAFVRPAAALLTLADCFDQHTTLIPGKQRFYVPIIISSTRKGSAQTKICGIPLGREPRRIKCCIGLFEGDDEAVTQEIANQFVATFDLESACIGGGSFHPLFSLAALQRRVLASDSSKLEQVMSIKHFLWLLESVPKDPRLRMRVPVAGTGRMEHHSFDSPSAALVKARKAFVLLNNADQERDASIAARAKTLPESHETKYLVLNSERYLQFRQQEFAPLT